MKSNYKQITKTLAITGGLFLSACNGGGSANNGQNTSTLSETTSSPTVAVSNRNTASTSTGGINEWPNYLAMGTISQGLTSSEPTSQKIDAIFTYNGANGNGDPGLIETPYKIYNMINMAKTIKQNTGYSVNPNIVEYQWQLSGGWNTEDVLNQDYLVKHLFNLAFLASTLQTDGYAATGTHGTILLNPDLLGFIGNTEREADIDALNIQVNSAVSQVSCMMSESFNFNNAPGCTYNWDKQPITTTGTVKDLINWLKGKTDNYSAGQAFSNCVESYVIQQCASKTANNQLPQFTSNFNGWIQAQNYLVHNYGPQVNLGWHMNISATPGGGWWVHENKNAVTPYVNQVLSLLSHYSVFSGTYKPDFIYFDRYGADDYAGSLADSAGQTLVQNQATLYNDQDWDNFLQMTKQISEGLASGFGKPYVPVMLWQIPAAHIQTNSEKIESGINAAEEGSAPDYFFGDPALDSSLNNIADWINPGVGTLNSKYGLCAGLTASQCLTLNNFNWGHSDNGKLQAAADAHVFSILWGAGGFATAVWAIPGVSFPDNGWMANTLNNYYANRKQPLN